MSSSGAPSWAYADTPSSPRLTPHHLSTAVSAAGIIGVVGASEPPVPDLVSDLGACVGAFGGIGAATGWTVGIIARGLGRDVDVAKWTGYTTGAGAVMGVAAYITFRLGGRAPWGYPAP